MSQIEKTKEIQDFFDSLLNESDNFNIVLDGSEIIGIIREGYEVDSQSDFKIQKNSTSNKQSLSDLQKVDLYAHPSKNLANWEPVFVISKDVETVGIDKKIKVCVHLHDNQFMKNKTLEFETGCNSIYVDELKVDIKIDTIEVSVVEYRTPTDVLSVLGLLPTPQSFIYKKSFKIDPKTGELANGHKTCWTREK